MSKVKEKQEQKKEKSGHKVTYIKRIINTIRGSEYKEDSLVLNTIVVDGSRTRKGEAAYILERENKNEIFVAEKKQNTPEARVGCDAEINRGDQRHAKAEGSGKGGRRR